MITLDEMAAMGGLSRKEITTLAALDRGSNDEATTLGVYLMHAGSDLRDVHGKIRDDIRDALRSRDMVQATRLFAVLRGFLTQHPEAAYRRD